MTAHTSIWGIRRECDFVRYDTNYAQTFSNARIYVLLSEMVGGSIPLTCLYVLVTYLRNFTYLRDFSFVKIIYYVTKYGEKSLYRVINYDTNYDTNSFLVQFVNYAAVIFI